MKFCWSFIFVWIGLSLCVGASSSQAPGHIYVALKAREQAPENIRAIIDANLSAYLAGATGPDIALTTYLIAEAFGQHHPGSEAHYEKTGELIQNMLLLANNTTDPKLKGQNMAFALGWLTHYCTDNVIHPLVNEFGGYFGAGGEYIVRHKRLELVECSHVFQKGYGDLDNNYCISSSAVPVTFICDAFRKTFPTESAYQSSIDVHSGMQLRPSFEADLGKSALLMAQATSWLLSAYRGETNYVRGPVFSTVLKGYPPTNEQYKKLMDPLVIERVELEEPKREKGETQGWIKVTYTINDLYLYKLFCQQWNARIEQAISSSVQFFHSFAANPQAMSIPDRNLDTGGAIGSTFDINTAWPGLPKISRLLAFAEIQNPKKQDVGPDAFKSGFWIYIPFVEANAPILNGLGDKGRPVHGDSIKTAKAEWNSDEQTGTAFFKIPIDCAEVGKYHAKIRIALAQENTKRLFGWEEQGQTIQASWEGELGGAPELSILFLVDTSGSMAGSKIEAARAAVKRTVDRTNDGKTEWALVRFGGCNVSVICRFTMEAEKIKQAADLLQAGGDTPFVYAREKSLSYLVRNGRGKIGRLVILCDGQDNCPEHGGITQPEASAQLQKLMQQVKTMPLGGGGQ